MEDNFFVPPIEESCTDDYTLYRSVIERYYSLRYNLNVTQPRDDYCILIHSNRVCIVTLAKSHFLFKKGSIVSIDFKINDAVDRSSNSVSGKWKRGAQRLTCTSPLLIVETEGGLKSRLASGINGKLLEVNKSLLEDPSVMLKEPQGRGYLAIVLPDSYSSDRYKSDLMDEEAYNKEITKRGSDS